MGKFDTTYNPAKIYNNSKASQPDNVDTKLEFNITLEVFKIINFKSNFDKICKLCIGSKQTHIVKQQKPMTPVKDKLKEVHVDF